MSSDRNWGVINDGIQLGKRRREMVGNDNNECVMNQDQIDG